MNYDSVNNLGGELQSQVRHQKGIKQKVNGNSSARSRAADFVAIVMCQAEQFHKRFVAQKGKHDYTGSNQEWETISTTRQDKKGITRAYPAP